MSDTGSTPRSSYGRRFTLNAAAAYLDVTPHQLRRFVRLGLVAYQRTPASPGQRRGGDFAFYEKDLDAFIAATRTEATAPPSARPQAARCRARNIDHLIAGPRELS